MRVTLLLCVVGCGPPLTPRPESLPEGAVFFSQDVCPEGSREMHHEPLANPAYRLCRVERKPALPEGGVLLWKDRTCPEGTVEVEGGQYGALHVCRVEAPAPKSIQAEAIPPYRSKNHRSRA